MILKRAIVSRVLATAVSLYGDCDTPSVRGFDLAVVFVNIADWSCRLPPNCSAAVQKLADRRRA